ncbi:hypothetical protein [Corallococcus llansteffanensis]|uniref:Uncharacterized protein n=1 Tax=Corallococcus llansteffanensis TaxID=2316731 RepID=A0A3A8P4R7_9BACT|nr:hypothetical protein [Corallococcus llansteffanensis]RKH50440.1 hypothetical protein D7V93_30545 [Corallococcus llansteffanensis]
MTAQGVGGLEQHPGLARPDAQGAEQGLLRGGRSRAQRARDLEDGEQRRPQRPHPEERQQELERHEPAQPLPQQDR